MAERKPPSTSVELEVLLASRRRCCICYGLHRDLDIKQGQLAHVNRDPSDSSADNLAFVCLEHHDWYDTRPSQSKAPTPAEVRHYREELYKELVRRDEAEALDARAHPAARAATAKPVPAVDADPGLFQPIEVIDEKLHLRWTVRVPPERWLDVQDPVRHLVPRAVTDYLDGPYHAAPDCNERLEEYGGGGGYGGGSPSLAKRCPGCGAELFRVVQRGGLESGSAEAWTVRAQALAELQRMSRNGTAIEGARIVLSRPLYWLKMVPPYR